jgi:hypothetical protein
MRWRWRGGGGISGSARDGAELRDDVDGGHVDEEGHDSGERDHSQQLRRQDYGGQRRRAASGVAREQDEGQERGGGNGHLLEHELQAVDTQRLLHCAHPHLRPPVTRHRAGACAMGFTW